MKALMAALALLPAIQTAVAYEPVKIDYRASVTANASTGDFAPYMLASWDYGRITGANGIWHDGMIRKEMTLDRRFNWGAGVEYIAGYGSAAEYDRYQHDGTYTFSARRQAPVRLHQLYAELKFRGVYLTAGMKERGPGAIVDGILSSGDLTRSNNARPLPGVAVGFVDFQNIPFTNGWVQIDGEIMYGRFMDKSFRENTFNYYSGLLSLDNWYIYRRCYFRTKPSQPFSVIVGMQAAGEFAGYAKRYSEGRVIAEYPRGFKFKDIFEMFFPREGSGEGFYKGNSLGSWDFKARYLFKNGSRLSAYFEWPWEDGSGIGKMTGWDGLWGLQYDFKEGSPINRIVVEYFDFTNQSGPMHWAPADHPGTDLTSQATGGDNYYNNDFYGPYSNYGMSIGSPFPVAPLYNLDGYPEYAHNRARGFHLGALGSIGAEWQCVAKVSYQQAGGTGRIPAPHRLHDTSAMLGAQWTPGARLSGLSVKAQMAFDAGNLRGNNFGAMVSVAYSGSFNIGKK
ncbi:MAG: capsule assembly Wzi family protein [Muribaculaceae bacterium]|nr:capsule assembly Wzi family protein [Muribaculaceae bacterium]